MVNSDKSLFTIILIVINIILELCFIDLNNNYYFYYFLPYFAVILLSIFKPNYYHSISFLIILSFFVSKFFYIPLWSGTFIFYFNILTIIILLLFSFFKDIRYLNFKKKEVIFSVSLVIIPTIYLIINSWRQNYLLRNGFKSKAIVVKSSKKYFTYEYTTDDNEKYTRIVPYFGNDPGRTIGVGDTLEIKISNYDKSISKMLIELE